jgi:RNA polymerase sigma-70 factor (ECF subfamily)
VQQAVLPQGAHTPVSDGELVRQTLAGRRAAFEDLVRRWAGRILALCHAKVRRADVAEDMAQEALLRAYRSLATLADPEKFPSWLYGIALRACLDWLKAKERTTVPFSVLDRDNKPDDYLAGRSDEPTIDQEDERRHMLAEVDALPDEYREVVMLYYYQDATYRDIAALLSVSPATINARLTKARALLRDRLTPHPCPSPPSGEGMHEGR